MFGLSVPELLLIGIVALLIFGPDKLPEIARSMGKWTGELKRHSDSIRREFYNSVYTPSDEKSLMKVDRSLSLSDTCEDPALKTAAVDSKSDSSPEKVSSPLHGHSDSFISDLSSSEPHSPIIQQEPLVAEVTSNEPIEPPKSSQEG